jgi:hypothetical protein
MEEVVRRERRGGLTICTLHVCACTLAHMTLSLRA